MKKTALALALLATSTLASAQSWRLLPVFEVDHRFEPTLALSVGTVDPDGAPPSATQIGLQLSFNCGLIQSPDNRIRSYFQINRSDKHGLQATAYELSPRYLLPLGQSFSIGAGPSLTAVHLSGNGTNKTLYGLGLAAGLDWRSGPFYAGADLRMHNTSSRGGVDYDSTTFGVKIGVNF
jgi:hypothetical protein